MRDDAELVIATRTGEPDAFGPLVERWLDRCWEVAWRILHDRDLAADVAQETLLTAWQQLDRLDKPASFGGWVLRIARNRALNRLERERRAVPIGDPELLEPRGQPTGLDDPAAALGRAEEHDLVWAAAAALGERDASILDLHLRHGLEPAELADELGIAPNAAHQALFRLRKRLGAAIQAWLLWRHGHPDCVVLRAELAAAGITSFGADAVHAIEQHAASCVSCTDERERVIAPAALFSAVPLVLIPAAQRAEILGDLVRFGVPITAPAATNGAGTGVQADDRRPEAAGPWLAVVALLVALTVIGGWWLWASDPTTVGEELTASVLELDEPEVPLAAPDASASSSDQGDGPDTVDDPPAPPVDMDGDGDLGHPDANGEADGAQPPPDQNAPGPHDDPQPDPSGGDQGESELDSAEADQAGDGAEEPPGSTPEPDPVAIERFVVEVVDACRVGGLRHRVTWSTSGAEAVTLSVDGGDPEPVDASGQVERCAARGAAFTLAAAGPGGTAEETATAG